MKVTLIETKIESGILINIPSRKKLIGYAFFCSMITTLLFPSSSFATYQYIYRGNTFLTTFNSRVVIDYPLDAYIETRAEYEHISVGFKTTTLLSAGAGLIDVPTFAVSADGYLDRVLAYPSPNPNPDFGWSDNGWPDINYVGTFNIFSVDSYGLPTDWNISVDYNYASPTGRFAQTFIKTTSIQDATYGGYEGWSDYLGQGDNNQGIWSVAIVPEPETYTILLTGLFLIGFMVNRRNIKKVWKMPIFLPIRKM